MFDFNDEDIVRTNDYFEDIQKFYCLEDVNKFAKRWKKCMDLKEDYVSFVGKHVFRSKTHVVLDPPSYKEIPENISNFGIYSEK